MSDDPKPDLAAVLDHYGVRHSSSRQIEMVSCPFHEDRTPSLSIRLDRGLWNCKSCGRAGDSYSLIMQKEDINFVGARTFAAGLGLANGRAGGGNRRVSGSRYAGGGSDSEGSGDRASGSDWVPSWRRR
ncbi:CHC2 zinc finger domain-containing protein [Cellulomonas sp. SG140]|uniref:CHC2 zinc finger domain-containing protein n=1 Tax=Cellulomonas sp. SG140 TaxID=2976536 RepID=UPI0021E97B3A|nr:CHC2 zinc finger domain-containing protein [Cellulomonas sp. SG140]